MDDKPRAVILLVDNDEEYLEALKIRLEYVGYTCLTACTGAQGVLTAENSCVDLVITDLRMPGGDGILLADRIRKHSPVPIIVATGFRESFREELRGIPDLSVITKPFDVDELLTMIESSLALSGAA